jgi:hypothetical protein
MATYQISVGQKKPKELPHYEPDELDDPDFQQAVNSLTADKAALAPRRALIDHAAKLQKQIGKGMEQRKADQERIGNLQAALEKAVAGAAIPAHITEEAERVKFVRNAFWEFVKTWVISMPGNVEALKLHRALLSELQEEMNELWPGHLGPQAEAKVERARKERGTK